jgi:hypothetical protein
VYVGGSGGACITAGDIQVVDLVQIRLLTPPPKIPDSYQINPDGWGDPWFEPTDLMWLNDHVVRATGLINDPGIDSTCDVNPAIWQRTYDTETATSTDSPDKVRAHRWLGQNCSNVQIHGDNSSYRLVAITEGASRTLGNFTFLVLSGHPKKECATDLNTSLESQS